MLRLLGVIRTSLVAIAILASAPAFAQRKSVPKELETDLKTIFAAKYVGVSSQGDVVKIRVQDGPMKAPSWAELRERARKAYAAVVAKAAGKIVVVDYAEAGEMAIAEMLPGTSAVDVRVGAGKVFQDDRAVFPLEITGGVTFVDSSTSNIPGRAKSATCAGKVKNLGTAERAVAVRCVVKRYTVQYQGETVELKSGLSKSEVIVDETVQVGKVKPGAEASFSRALSAKEWPMMHGVGGELVVTADGAPTSYIDGAALALATDWLAVLDKLRADGLAVETRDPYDPLTKLGDGMVELTLDLVGDDLEKRDPAQLGKAAERAWTALKTHYDKFHRAFPQAVKLRGKMMNKATITDGKLGPWREDMF